MTRREAEQYRRHINTVVDELPDEAALGVLDLFLPWAESADYAAGDRRKYDDKLYRCEQAHTSQADWTPDKTPALWTEVAKPGQGDTPDNPIPYNNNMELFKDKYYSQNGIVYVCIRDTGVPVYNNLADLVGLYVTVWEEET